MNKILLPVDGSKRSLRTLRAPAYILAHKSWTPWPRCSPATR